jgi:AraC-like DNA-binding protein
MVEIFQNIRQPYDFAAPCAELAPYVEFFAESARDMTRQPVSPAPYQAKMFASWTPTLYFNLGPAYTLDLGDTRYQVPAAVDVLLLRNRAVVRHVPPADHCFTVKFYPGGLEAVLGLSQVGLADRLVLLGQVLPPWLPAQLRQACSFAERTDLMQRYLVQAQRGMPAPDHYLRLVSEAIGEYQATGLQLRTSAVAERLFLTSKTINRYFHRVVGTGPKEYFALLRARAALTAFVANPAEFAPDDYGYYDRSHFGRDIRNFTGQSLPKRSR